MMGIILGHVAAVLVAADVWFATRDWNLTTAALLVCVLIVGAPGIWRRP